MKIGKKLRSLEGGMVAFWCPGCDSMHTVGIEEPSPVIWKYNGDPDAPTFKPSILLRWTDHEKQVREVCHSFVTDGRIKFLGDCTHALAGKTVDLPDIE